MGAVGDQSNKISQIRSNDINPQDNKAHGQLRIEKCCLVLLQVLFFCPQEQILSKYFILNTEGGSIVLADPRKASSTWCQKSEHLNQMCFWLPLFIIKQITDKMWEMYEDYFLQGNIKSKQHIRQAITIQVSIWQSVQHSLCTVSMYVGITNI